MMARIFWDAIFFISGSLFALGAAGQSNSTIIEANLSINTNSTAALRTSASSTAVIGNRNAITATIATAAMKIPAVKGSLFTLGAGQGNSTIIGANISISRDSIATPNTSKSSSAAIGTRNTSTTTFATATTATHPVKKFVAAAFRFHFDDCPDSHRHFCFHGTCRFLILEETPACVCHPGFVGMRCEHADLLAVVATKHRQHTVFTMLVLCVIVCVLIVVLCTFLHCWWRQDCHRWRQAHHYVPQKHGASCYPSESVV